MFGGVTDKSVSLNSFVLTLLLISKTIQEPISEYVQKIPYKNHTKQSLNLVTRYLTRTIPEPYGN